MNVLLISQCEKRALTETRRILDQFAERRGDRTWQTPITQEGLDTLRRLLRKTARKNTAVSCHWIRGIDRSELLWVVGDRSRFSEQGAVPTNTTTRDILRHHDENDWHTGELIQRLTDLAGLLHDLGKAIEAFQLRLTGDLVERNLIRHEWVSLRLLEAFVGQDDDTTWLSRLAAPTDADHASWLTRLKRDRLDGSFASPFAGLMHAPLAQALGWLVVTHHRLPQLPDKAQFQMSMLPSLLTQLQPSWNEPAIQGSERDALRPYWHFPKGLPVTNSDWQKRASRVAKHLLAHIGRHDVSGVMNNPFVLHVSRLCLMLADHHYSGLEEKNHPERVKVESSTTLVANTRAGGLPNQMLDEHLVGVAQHGAEVARFLPRFEHHLPRLGKHRRLKQRAQHDRFRWQDKAADLAVTMRERSQQQGAFVINMASTGCGKTLANARIMYALADPVVGMRCAFALGLRTLTLQTGRVFRDLLGLTDDDLAIRVGGSTSRALFEHHEAQAEATGSASKQALLDEETHVVFDGSADGHPLLRRAVADPQVRALLLAPLLVCTIDHLTPATESQRGGRQIAPMLRLLSGDLVLDEPDDFDLADLPALTRLVHWAGLLGSRVLLSSATLPPSLVQGLFEAYRNGRQHFLRNRGARPLAAETLPAICCAWVDEFHQHQADCHDSQAFERTHLQFATKRHGELARLAVEPRRRATLLPMPALPKDLPSVATAFAPLLLEAACGLHHHHHSVDPRTGKRVSFGLMRMANIEPLYEVALSLFQQGAPGGRRIHLCVYHSQHPLLVRSTIERQLDTTLQRGEPGAVFTRPDIRQRLDTSPEPDQLFIVLGSPVTEVGRDHDYDWAVVEPSSMRSLIQLAGRVRRHRAGTVTTPNIAVFRYNLRHFRQPGQASYCKPGFETSSEPFQLSSHDLQKLLQPEEFEVIDARPRIVSRPQLQPQHRLADLEHGRMRQTMLLQARAHSQVDGGRRARGGAAQDATQLLSAATWWHQAPQDSLLTALLPQQQRFRDDTGQQDVELALLPDKDGEDCLLHRIERKPTQRGDNPYVLVDRSQHERIPDHAVSGLGIQPWGVTNYLETLIELASELDMSPLECSRRYGTVTVPSNDNGWRYHAVLGFAKRR